MIVYSKLEWIEEIFKVSNQKVMFICGDVNIDLHYPVNHKPTEDHQYNGQFTPLSRNQQTQQDYTLRDNMLQRTMQQVDY